MEGITEELNWNCTPEIYLEDLESPSMSLILKVAFFSWQLRIQNEMLISLSYKELYLVMQMLAVSLKREYYSSYGVTFYRKLFIARLGGPAF